MLTLNRRQGLRAVSGAVAQPLIAPRLELRVWVRDDQLSSEAATSPIRNETPSLSAFVVSVGGRIAFESYADGFGDDDTTDI